MQAAALASDIAIDLAVTKWLHGKPLSQRHRAGLGAHAAPTMPHPAASSPSPRRMAIKSTIFKAALQLADIDHGVYSDLALTIARHPSETDARMMVRIVALALQAHAVQTECQGNAAIGFGAGLSDPDDPDVRVTDYTGRVRRWIEVGQPEDRPLARAASLADGVVVYAFSSAAEVWWKNIERKLTRLDRLSVFRIPADTVDELVTLTERSMQLQATVQDGVLTLSGERGVVLVEPHTWRLGT